MVCGWPQEKGSVRTVRTAVAGILVDESFSISMEEIKKCLSVAQSLMKHFNCDQAWQSCETFCSWLVDVLEEAIEKLKSGMVLLIQKNYGPATTN